MVEKRFQFRTDLITSNESFSYRLRKLQSDEISLSHGVVFSGDNSPTIQHAIDDLKDCLKVCFGIEKNTEQAIKIKIVITQENLEDVCSYKGRI